MLMRISHLSGVNNYMGMQNENDINSCNHCHNIKAKPCAVHKIKKVNVRFKMKHRTQNF